jgi:hypothetical protein
MLGDCFSAENSGPFLIFLIATTLYSGGVRSHDPYLAPVSSVAGGDATSISRRQCLCLFLNPFWPIFVYIMLGYYDLFRQKLWSVIGERLSNWQSLSLIVSGSSNSYLNRFSIFSPSKNRLRFFSSKKYHPQSLNIVDTCPDIGNWC